MSNFFEKLIKYLCYFIVFLLPLFWLPFSFEVIEFNKLYFLFFFSWLGVILWFLKQIVKERAFIFRYNLFDILLVLFLVLAVLSSVFSKDKINSIFGTYGRFSDGILTLFAFFGFYLLLRNNLKTEEREGIEINTIFRLLLSSSFLVILFTIFSVFNLWQKIPVLKNYLPFSLAGSSAFSLAFFLALIFVLAFSYLFLGKGIKRLERGFLILLLLFDFFLLFIFDFSLAWFFIFLSLFLFSLFCAIDRVFGEKVEMNLIPLSISLFVLVLLFLNLQAIIVNFFPKTQNFFLSLPGEFILPQKESFRVAFKSAISSPKNIFLGSGPGTFLEDFSLFKSRNFWSFRFNLAGNNFAQILANFGFLGATLFSLILAFLAILVFLKKVKPEFFFVKLFLFSLFLLQFLFYQNLLFGFLFWLGLAIAANLILFKEKRIELKENPVVALFVEALTILLILAFFFSLFLGTVFYLADYNYKKGFLEPDLEKKISFFQKAVSFNQYQPYYKMVLSQALSQKFQKEAQKENPDQNLLYQTGILAINFAKAAKDSSPNNILFRENLAFIYRDLGTLELSLKEFEEATKLEPQNATFYLEMGKNQLTLRNLEEAKKNFEKAIEIEPNFAQAILQKALTLELEQNLDGGISELEEFLSKNPNFSEGYFHLGRMYYLKGNYSKAKENLDKALVLFPNYSNARYFLALVYEKEGEIQKAIEELEKVQALNPDSELVKSKINELKEKLSQK